MNKKGRALNQVHSIRYIKIEDKTIHKAPNGREIQPEALNCGVGWLEPNIATSTRMAEANHPIRLPIIHLSIISNLIITAILRQAKEIMGNSHRTAISHRPKAIIANSKTIQNWEIIICHSSANPVTNHGQIWTPCMMSLKIRCMEI